MKHTGPVFLSTVAAGAGDRRLAFAFLAASGVAFVAMAPFARTPLGATPAFLPVYQSAYVINDLITAVLLFGQFEILGLWALLVLACGYLLSACMAVAHALSFPGLFSPTGLLGAGPQTTAWLYFLWHGAFPLFVVAYALLKGRVGTGAGSVSTRIAIVSATAAVFVFAALLMLIATAAHDSLPAIMQGDKDASTKILAALGTWTLVVIALAVLWLRRPHSVLDLWLMVAMSAWVFDVALAAVLNHARYDLGWYAGRIYGLLAGSFVLVVLLLENGKLYARLAESSRRLASVNQELDASLADLRELNHELDRRVEQRTRDLARANESLLEADRRKDEFIAMLSHELRNPLAAIGNSLFLLDQSDAAAREANGARKIISRQFGILNRLVNELLEATRIAHHKIELQLSDVDLCGIVADTLQDYRSEFDAAGISVAVSLPEAPVRMGGDASRLIQLVANLLQNAARFTGKGGVVSVSLEKQGSDTAIIRVKDTGMGIAPEILPLVFEPFVQARQGLDRSRGGLGLGLSLVKTLADMHGGSVEAYSAGVGRGAEFVVRLPLPG